MQCQDEIVMGNLIVFSPSAEAKLIELLGDKSDKVITMLTDKSDIAIDKAITMLADKSDKAIDAVTDVMKDIGSAAKEYGGAGKEIKEILFIVKCAIGVGVIGYGINWAWRR
jgi:hypothetical protein